MSRDVPFNQKASCDRCNAIGAYDFMGDYVCQACLDRPPVWSVDDNTGPCGGFLRIMRDGVRVVDAFPFARDADQHWVREQVAVLVRTMNEYEQQNRM